MQPKKMKAQKLDRGKIENLLKQEDEYISNLLKTFNVPDSIYDENVDEFFLKNTKDKVPQKKIQANIQRAQTIDDLQERLEVVKNKHKNKKSKPSERTIKKRQEKKLKKEKELKKRIISLAKSNKNEKIKEEKFMEDNKDLVKPAAVFNEEGKIVFSKFEFAANPKKAKKNKNQKIEKNPKLVLQSLKKQQKQFKELEEQGDTEKVEAIKKDLAWKKAFDKIEGLKVKDNTTLLHKSLKRRKVEKKKSKLNWKKRDEKVQKDIDNRQKKRQENINKKKDEKKKHKLKKLAKRGRIIPGYN